ncbi:MAG: hypothetical protein GXX85_09865 [Ignavibacteria bacterium]|nr:hypothetical protein [Ignavibacteria bacterium]
MKKILAIFTTLSVFLAVWQMTENRINVDRINNDETSLEAFLPTPSTIYTSFKDNFGLIISETLITLERAFAGFVSGFIMAVAIVALFSFFPILRHVGIPISVAINSFPIIGFSPIIILFFGQGTSLSIVFISMLISYFPILINLDNFVRGIPADIFNMMKSQITAARGGGLMNGVP